MSMRLTSKRTPKGSNAATLRKWGILFLTAGIVGRSILENAVIGINGMSSEELYNAMSADPMVMAAASASIFCKLLETCAVPLFCFLLVEGFRRTSCFEKYLIRIIGIALITELPYNLAMGGSLLYTDSRNPVFALAFCLIMLYFYQRYPRMKLTDVLMKILISVAAFLWCVMLQVDHGIFVVVMVVVLWTTRNKGNMRAISGFCAAMVCTMLNMYYIGACLSSILLHRYTEERGEQNQMVNYAAYPVLLLVCGIVAKFL